MRARIRSAVWGLATLANIIACWALWNALGIFFRVAAASAEPDGGGSMGAAGAMVGSSVGLLYALVIAIVPTCLALGIDKLTRAGEVGRIVDPTPDPT